MGQEPLALSADLDARIQAVGLDFLAKFLEVETSRNPANLDALAELGHVYTRLQRHQEGLAVDQRLVRLAPQECTVHYNLACSLALLGRSSESLDSLERAIELGYDDAEFMLGDADLAGVREDPRFRELLTRIQ